MNERIGQNHSSDQFTLTRVIPARKARALNLSRILEQALTSILDYLPQENETVSSKSLIERSLPEKALRARGSVRLERRTLNP